MGIIWPMIIYHGYTKNEGKEVMYSIYASLIIFRPMVPFSKTRNKFIIRERVNILRAARGGVPNDDANTISTVYTIATCKSDNVAV